MKIDNFFSELKRRNIYKVAVAYAVVAWLLMQIATQIFPFFEIPNWAVRLVVLLLVLGFPVALILAWAFDLTPDGIKRAEDVVPDESITRRTGRKLTGVIIVLALVAAALGIFQIVRPKPARMGPSATPLTSGVAAPQTIPEKSIAVLPFENLSDDKQNSFFTDGVQDEILTDLARIADLKVISRTSVMQYKETAKRNLPEIAQALKVAHVLEGSVQRAANRVRVNAQLIDARTDAHLWAQRFDGDLADVFAIQAEIAQKIADQLQAVLSPNEKAAIAAKPTQDLAAYELYLRAKEIDQRSLFYLPQQNQEESRILEQAVARDPAFVPALCLLARVHLQAYWFRFDQRGARLEQGKKAIAAAARVQPDAGEVHLARALLHYWGEQDYAGALAELALAGHALPNDASIPHFTGAIERRQSDWESAIRHIEQALNLDPQNALMISELTITYEACRRYADAARVMDAGLRWKPEDFGFQLFRAATDRDRSADLHRSGELVSGSAARTADPDLVAASRLFLALDRRDFRAAESALADYHQPDVNASGFRFPREMHAGLLARAVGDTARAQSALQRAREHASERASKQHDDAKSLVGLALVDAYLGQRDDAIREGERAAALLPLAKDAFEGPLVQIYLATIYAQLGEKGRALDLLEQLAQMPAGPSYGDLKLGLEWDPLRTDPRFEKIIAALAPKDAGK